MSRKKTGRKSAKIRHNTIKTFSFIKDVTPIFLSVIAVIAIIWYLATSYDVTNKWWFLPLIAVVTGALSIILPLLCARFKLVISIISTGFAILLLQTLAPFITFSLIPLTSILLLIALFTELSVNGFDLGNVIFDACICLATAWVLLQLSYPIAKIIVMLICYIAVLISNFNISLSRRRYRRVKDTNSQTDINQE